MNKFDYTNAPISKSLLRLALPSMGASFFSSIYNLIDTFWIGHLGADQVAGVTLAMMIFYYGSIFNDLFGTPSVIMISRRYGEGNYEEVKWVVGQTILAKIALGTIFMIIAYIFLGPLLTLIGANKNTFAYGMDFLKWRLWVIPLSFAGYTMMTTFRGTGDSYKLFWVQGISAGINILLDPILIYSLGMGVSGAAIASDISEIYLLVMGMILLNSQKSYLKFNPFGYMKPRFDIIKKMVSLGIPSVFDTFSANFVYTLVLKFASFYGADLVAALGIVNNIRSISFTLGFSMNMSTSTMIGQNLGAKKHERLKKIILTSVWIGELLIAGYVFALFLFGSEITYFFTPNQNVAMMGGVIMKFFAINEIFFIIAMIGYGVLTGGGLTRTTMMIGIISDWLVLAPLVVIFSLLHMRWEFLIFAFVIQSFVMAMLAIWEVKKGKWIEQKI
ncbi:MATE family efflux transporter [Athalassotoga saccharophila]|uniref:MATE family efflux transporter n=1 Tax=Athalassotoga saccharophila TaxID=1441386 RepID=UPI00137B8B41|nr:MATE family efflux transporter [Athalassotoga saccharophila]BBJ28551.1 multidrug export protein MepA [Athalassotoga saccharophila]